MHGRPIQGIFTVLDSKESRRLLEGLVAKTFDFLQLRARPKPTRLLPSRDDVQCELRIDPRDVFQ